MMFIPTNEEKPNEDQPFGGSAPNGAWHTGAVTELVNFTSNFSDVQFHISMGNQPNIGTKENIKGRRTAQGPACTNSSVASGALEHRHAFFFLFLDV